MERRVPLAPGLGDVRAVGRAYRDGMRARVRALLVIVLAAGGCVAGGQYQPQGPLEPLVVGSEQHFALDWQAEPREPGVVVWGYANNTSPYTFDRLRLLVDALGPDGQLLGQQLVWSVGRLGAWGRNYFEARMPPAHAYRVRVFSYDRVEDGGFRRRW
jgi:hypothetical protein